MGIVLKSSVADFFTRHFGREVRFLYFLELLVQLKC